MRTLPWARERHALGYGADVVDHSQPLDESQVSEDPFAQFARWIEEAAAVTREPSAAALATAAASGRPSVRMVLVVAWGVEGFCFHSDLASRKGSDLRANPTAALLFNWDALGRQVRIEGPVERLRGEESDLYFATRPRAAQLVVRASRQSASIESRAALEAQLHAVTEAFSGQHVPRPATWGGFRLRPEYFELWQHREDRLHDRLAYRRRVVSPGAADVPEGRPAEWELDRLQP